MASPYADVVKASLDFVMEVQAQASAHNLSLDEAMRMVEKGQSCVAAAAMSKINLERMDMGLIQDRDAHDIFMQRERSRIRIEETRAWTRMGRSSRGDWRD